MVYMDPMRDPFIDLESGTNSTNLGAPRDDVSGVGQAKNLFSKVWSGFVSSDGLIKGPGEEAGNSGDPFSTDLIEGLVQSGEGREEKLGAERKNKKGIKKSPKPPRPPKSPSLDAADQKFIREISELAMLKRARMERMKKMKNTKAASSNSSMYALAITIIFCIVIIWQGVFSRDSSSLTSQRSPTSSSVGSRAGLISV